MGKRKIFTEEEKQQIIQAYTVERRSADSIGFDFGCSAPTILKNLREWGIGPNSRILDLTGKTFGELTAIKPAPRRNDRYTRWLCRCSCGNEIEVRTDFLTSGHTKSCGCQKGKLGADHTGETFGEWTIIKKGNKESYWLCRCSCGVEREVYYPSLVQGKSTSCGHLNNGKIRKPIIGNRYGNLVVLEQFKKNDDWYCTCQCDCGNTTTVTRKNLVSGNTQSCGCIVSKGEARIKRLLQDAQIPFISQWTPEDISNKKYKYDFYVDNKYVIEFDGPQHDGQVSGYYTQEKVDDLMQRDKEKNNYCLKHNIPIYRILYKYRDTITLEMLTNEQFLVKDFEISPDMEEIQDV